MRRRPSAIAVDQGSPGAAGWPKKTKSSSDPETEVSRSYIDRRYGQNRVVVSFRASASEYSVALMRLLKNQRFEPVRSRPLSCAHSSRCLKLQLLLGHVHPACLRPAADPTLIPEPNLSIPLAPSG